MQRSFILQTSYHANLFRKRHVAIVRDPTTLVHANAFHMAVAIEPLREAIARIRAAGSEVTSVKHWEPLLPGEPPQRRGLTRQSITHA